MPISTVLSAGITSFFRERGRPGRRHTPGGRRSSRPRLEVLEGRTLLTTDIVHNTNDSGAGSLRDTISSASPGDTITFASDVTGTITLTGGDLDFKPHQDLVIEGPGAGILTISGNDASNVFNVSGGATATIEGLTIAHGNTQSGGGGIANFGTLTVTNCTISGNSAPNGTGFTYGGGGIFNIGTLTVTDSTISGNSSPNRYGGGISNRGTLTATNCTISGNSAPNGPGGGMSIFDGTVNVTDCTISGNSATGAGLLYPGGGGGFYQLAGELIVSDCTITGNSVSGSGWGGGIDSISAMTVTNSTFSGNYASSGGAISSDLSNGGGGTLTNCTISGNSAEGGGGIYNSGSITVADCTIAGNSASGVGGGIENRSALGGGHFTVANTIVAGNTGSPAPDIYGSVTSLGFNLIGNSSGGGGFVATDLLNVNPFLGPLQDNGGLAETLALLPGSPAIAAGDVALVPSGITTDQRGASRTENGTVDIGAFEVQVFQVSNTSDSSSGGSLRYALTQANLFGGSVITFMTSGLISLATPLPVISRDVQIHGRGASNLTVSGKKVKMVFNVAELVTATITGLTIADGGGSSYGGGITNAGTLTVADCTISGNSAPGGSGEFGDGGGGIFNLGTLAVNNCTISGNSAPGGSGGGIWSAGTLTVTDSTLSNNSASVSGGGIYIDGGTGKITNSTLSGNSAGIGGGIIAYRGTLTLANTIVAMNTAQTGADVDGTVSSKGYNLIGDSSGGSGFVATDLLNLNPLLGTLQNNGGPTETMALLAGSPAIATGSVALIPPGITTDQRGSARVVNGTLDIGAFESGLAPPAPTVVLERVVTKQKTNKKGKPVGKPVFVGFALDFSTAMDPTTAGLTANYQVDTGVIKRSKNKMKVLHPVKFTAAYSHSTNSVTLTLKRKPTFPKGGEIAVIASAPNGVSSTAGVLLDSSDTVFTILPKAKGVTAG